MFKYCLIRDLPTGYVDWYGKGAEYGTKIDFFEAENNKQAKEKAKEFVDGYNKKLYRIKSVKL